MLKRVGFFRELRHGTPDGPGLAESIRSIAAANEDKIIRYLRLSPTFAASGPMVDDAIDPSNKSVAPLETATDGQWVWPRDLAYYVETYHIELPGDFVSYMQEQDWRPPELSANDLARLASEFIETI